MVQRLYERRDRILRVALRSMIPAVLAGVGAFPLSFLLPFTRPPRPFDDLVREGLMNSFNTAAVVFWAVFLVWFLIEMTKSHAVLELERRVRYAEELFRRAREN